MTDNLRYLQKDFEEKEQLDYVLSYTDKEGNLIEKRGKGDPSNSCSSVTITRPDGRKTVVLFGAFCGIAPFRREITYETDGTVRKKDYMLGLSAEKEWSYADEGIIGRETIEKANGDVIERTYESVRLDGKKPTGRLLNERRSENGKKLYRTYEEDGSYFEEDEKKELRHFFKDGTLDYYGKLSSSSGPVLHGYGTLYNPDGSVRSEVSEKDGTRCWYAKDGKLEMLDEGEFVGDPKRTDRKRTYFDKKGKAIKVEDSEMVQTEEYTKIQRIGRLKYTVGSVLGISDSDIEFVTCLYDKNGKLVSISVENQKTGKKFTSTGLSARLTAGIRGRITSSVPNHLSSQTKKASVFQKPTSVKKDKTIE